MNRLLALALLVHVQEINVGCHDRVQDFLDFRFMFATKRDMDNLRPCLQGSHLQTVEEIGKRRLAALDDVEFLDLGLLQDLRQEELALQNEGVVTARIRVALRLVKRCLLERSLFGNQ